LPSEFFIFYGVHHSRMFIIVNK